jgi:hypothetical protein
MYRYRFQFYPGLSGEVSTNDKRDLPLITLQLEGIAHGSRLYMERIHPRKQQRSK